MNNPFDPFNLGEEYWRDAYGDSMKNPYAAAALVDYVDKMRDLEAEGVVRWDEERENWVYNAERPSTGKTEDAPLMLRPDDPDAMRRMQERSEFDHADPED